MSQGRGGRSPPGEKKSSLLSRKMLLASIFEGAGRDLWKKGESRVGPGAVCAGEPGTGAASAGKDGSTLRGPKRNFFQKGRRSLPAWGKTKRRRSPDTEKKKRDLLGEESAWRAGGWYNFMEKSSWAKERGKKEPLKKGEAL